MANNSSVDQAALAFKILDGKASPEEQQVFDLWLSQDQQHWEEFADLKLLWENSNYRSTETDPDAFQQIKRIVERDRRKKKVLRYALYLVALVVVSVVLYLATARSMSRQSISLKFDNETIDQIIKNIEGTYHVTIERDEAIGSCKFSGIFYKNDEPETIIRSVANSLNVQVLKLAENKYKLTGRGC